MKKIIHLAICLLLIASCATKPKGPDPKKVALATQREGEMYVAQGRYSLALQKLLVAEKELSNDPFLKNSLGLAYMGKEKYKLAEQTFRKALKISPDYVAAKNNLGATLLKQEEYNQAIKIFEEVLDNILYATPHFPLSNLGWCYLGKRKYAAALRYFEKALDFSPLYTTAMHGKAQTYIQSLQIETAINYLDKSLRNKHDSAILHADLAEAYESIGAYKKAKISWHTVLRLVKYNTPLARKAEKRLDALE